MVKKLLISMGMLGVVIITLASSGGSASKKSAKASSGLSLVRSNAGFSLKAGRNYSNFLHSKSADAFHKSNVVVTYRKGNTIYILPAAPGSSASRSNLSLIRLNVPLHK